MAPRASAAVAQAANQRASGGRLRSCSTGVVLLNRDQTRRLAASDILTCAVSRPAASSPRWNSSQVGITILRLDRFDALARSRQEPRDAGFGDRQRLGDLSL